MVSSASDSAVTVKVSGLVIGSWAVARLAVERAVAMQGPGQPESVLLEPFSEIIRFAQIRAA